MSNSALDAPDSTNLSDTFQPRASERNMLLAAKGGGITFAGKLFTLASRLVIAFLLARFLGAADYGLYNLAIAALTVAASLAIFGLDTTLVRYIAVFARRRDEAGLWGTLQLGLGITTILSVLIGIGLYALARPIAEELFDEPQLAPLLRLVSLVVPFLTLSGIIAAATQGFKKMQYTTIARDIFQPMIRLILIVGLAMVGLNVVGAVASFGLAVMLSSVMLLYFLHKLFSLKRPLHTARRDNRELLSFSLPVFLSDLMTTFRGNIQALLLGMFNTVASVGIFTVANHLTMIGHMFQSAIATASRPIISELYDQGDWEQMGHMYQTTTKWTFAVNLPLFLTLVLFPTQILSIFGKTFTAGFTALILLASADMVDIGTGMCGLILDMTGHTMLKLINNIVRFVLAVGLSILLIPQWGLVGAATAALLVVSTTNLLRLLQVFILFRLLPYDLSFVKPIMAGLAALFAVLAIGYWVPNEASLIYTALSIIILFVVYVGMILLLGLSPEDRAVLARLRKPIGRLLSRSESDDHQPQT